jgi:hypothetical protein
MKRFLLAAMFVAGCAPTTYSFTPASAKGVVASPENCTFEVLTSSPDRNYEEIGTLAYYNGKEPTTIEAFKKAVAKQTCKAGGQAVIATANEKGQYMKGSIIVYLGDMATPVKPISDMPAPQATDADAPPPR